MHLLIGARRTVVMMEHLTKNLEQADGGLQLPDQRLWLRVGVYTSPAIFDFCTHCFRLVEAIEGINLQNVYMLTSLAIAI